MAKNWRIKTQKSQWVRRTTNIYHLSLIVCVFFFLFRLSLGAFWNSCVHSVAERCGNKLVPHRRLWRLLRKRKRTILSALITRKYSCEEAVGWGGGGCGDGGCGDKLSSVCGRVPFSFFPPSLPLFLPLRAGSNASDGRLAPAQC